MKIIHSWKMLLTNIPYNTFRTICRRFQTFWVVLWYGNRFTIWSKMPNWKLQSTWNSSWNSSWRRKKTEFLRLNLTTWIQVSIPILLWKWGMNSMIKSSTLFWEYWPEIVKDLTKTEWLCSRRSLLPLPRLIRLPKCCCHG